MREVKKHHGGTGSDFDTLLKYANGKKKPQGGTESDFDTLMSRSRRKGEGESVSELKERQGMTESLLILMKQNTIAGKKGAFLK